MARKPSKGRQKIEIKKIENIDARQVCFSKRRSGLFKKANELCVLCGAEVAIIVFSPAGKVFSFGHPSVESVLERFLTYHESAPATPAMALFNPFNDNNNNGSITIHREGVVRELSRQYCELASHVEAEKKRKKELQRAAAGAREHMGFWWEADIEGLELRELENYKIGLEELRQKVVRRAMEVGFFGGAAPF